MDSSRIIENLEFLVELSESRIPDARRIIIQATQDQIKAVVECILNTTTNNKTSEKLLQATRNLKPYFYRRKTLQSLHVKNQLATNIRDLKVIIVFILHRLTEESVLSKLLES